MAFDLHEIILSRGDVQGAPKELLLDIMHECNCGWAHRKCHQLAEGGDGRLRGIMYLLKYEGITRVRQWCTEINEQLLQTTFMNDVNLVIEFLDATLRENTNVQYPRHDRETK